MKDNISKYLSLCRLCLSKSGPRIGIFREDGKKRELFEKILNCLSLMVSENDQFPKLVCISCANLLDVIQGFRDKCHKSERLLSEYISGKDNEILDILTFSDEISSQLSKYTGNACRLTVEGSDKSEDELNKTDTDEVVVELSSEDSDDPEDKLREIRSAERRNKSRSLPGRKSSEAPTRWSGKSKNKIHEPTVDNKIIELPVEHSDDSADEVCEIYAEEYLDQRYSSNAKTTSKLATYQSGDSAGKGVKVCGKSADEVSSIERMARNCSLPSDNLPEPFIRRMTNVGENISLVNEIPTELSTKQNYNSNHELVEANINKASELCRGDSVFSEDEIQKIREGKLRDKVHKISVGNQAMTPSDDSSKLYEVFRAENLNQNCTGDKTICESSTSQCFYPVSKIVRGESTDEASSVEHMIQDDYLPAEILSKSFIEQVTNVGDKTSIVSVGVLQTDLPSDPNVNSESEILEIDTSIASGQISIERNTSLENAINEVNTIASADKFSSVSVNSPSKIANSRDILNDNNVVSDTHIVIYINDETHNANCDSRKDYEMKLEDTVLTETVETEESSETFKNPHNQEHLAFPESDGCDFNETKSNSDVEVIEVFPVRIEETCLPFTECSNNSETNGEERRQIDKDLFFPDISNVRHDQNISQSVCENVSSRKAGCSSVIRRKTQLHVSSKRSESVTSKEVRKKRLLKLSYGNDKFSCKLCSKTMSSANSLQIHLRTHKSEKSFQCILCNRKFSQQVNLRNHLRTHTGERPYECKQCNKTFSQKTTLDNHLRLHTGEKPFKCKKCSRGFAQKTNLDNHSRIHTGDRPYVCLVCDKRFVQQGQLRTHRKLHET